MQPLWLFHGQVFLCNTTKENMKTSSSSKPKRQILAVNETSGHRHSTWASTLPGWRFEHCDVPTFVPFYMFFFSFLFFKVIMKNYPVLSNFGSRRLQILEDLRAAGETPPDVIACRRRRLCFWWRKSRSSWEAWLLFVPPVTSWVSTRGTSRCPPWAASRRSAARVCKAKTAVRLPKPKMITAHVERTGLSHWLNAGREPESFGYNAACCTLGGAVVKKIAFLLLRHKKPRNDAEIIVLQLIITTI